MTEPDKFVSNLEEGMEIARFQTAVTENCEQFGKTISIFAALHKLKDQEVAYLLCFHAGMLIAGAPREIKDELVRQHQRIIAETVRLAGRRSEQ